MKINLFEYCLRLGDTSLILGQRLCEWCGHGPILEEDIALGNIALDLIGQSRTIYTYACEIEGNNRTEDDLAYLRDVRQYRNILLAEQPNVDFAVTIIRQFFISTFQYFLYRQLQNSNDEMIKGFALKSIKEVAYHLRHSEGWVLRLGDGTYESHQRIQGAVNDLWIFTDDIFAADDVDDALLKAGIAADLKIVKQEWDKKIKSAFDEATLIVPSVNSFMRTGSRSGNHTEHMGYILAEMQFLPRAYPGTKW